MVDFCFLLTCLLDLQMVPESSTNRRSEVYVQVGPRIALAKLPYVKSGNSGFWIRWRILFFMAKPDLDMSYIKTIFLKKKQVWVTFATMALQKPVPIILCELYTYYIRNIQFFCLKKSKRYYVHKEHFIKKRQIRYISGELHKEHFEKKSQKDTCDIRRLGRGSPGSCC